VCNSWEIGGLLKFELDSAWDVTQCFNVNVNLVLVCQICNSTNTNIHIMCCLHARKILRSFQILFVRKIATWNNYDENFFLYLFWRYDRRDITSLKNHGVWYLPVVGAARSFKLYICKEQRYEMMWNYFVSGWAVKSFGISTWRMFTMWKFTVGDIYMRWELSGGSNSVFVFKLRDEILWNSFVSVWAFKSFEILNSLVMSRYKTQSEIDISF